jgi:hypothetical protein
LLIFSFYLSVCLSVYLTFCLSLPDFYVFVFCPVFLSFFHSFSLSISKYQSLCLSISQYLYLSISLSISISISPCLSLLIFYFPTFLSSSTDVLGRTDVLEERLLLARLVRHLGHVELLQDAGERARNCLVAEVAFLVVGTAPTHDDVLLARQLDLLLPSQADGHHVFGGVLKSQVLHLS